MKRSLKSAISAAEQKGAALGHFNISNLEQLKAIAHAALKLGVPVIVGVSEGERDYIGIHHTKDLVDSYNQEHGNPSADGGFWIFLNADHTHSLEAVRKAAEADFDAVLFDGGKLSLEEDIKQTIEAVKIVKGINPRILVEGELGNIGSSSEIRKEIPKGAAIRSEDLTTPEDALRFMKETGVDMLAPAVGNIHGMFANAPEPELDIKRIVEIKKVVGVPLVLHGGSGNTDEEFRAAIGAGISIIHISTELRVAWRKGMEKALKDQPDEVAPYKLVPIAVEDMEVVVEKKLKLFSGPGM